MEYEKSFITPRHGLSAYTRKYSTNLSVQADKLCTTLLSVELAQYEIDAFRANVGEIWQRLFKHTVDSRYLDIGYFEQPFISKKNLVLVITQKSKIRL